MGNDWQLGHGIIIHSFVQLRIALYFSPWSLFGAPTLQPPLGPWYSEVSRTAYLGQSK